MKYGIRPRAEIKEADRIGIVKSASVYECGRFHFHLGQMAPKPVAGLPTQVVNDKGRLLQ
jgi:hypothetical protein